MIGIDNPWVGESDESERQALAAGMLDDILRLSQSAGWQHLVAAIDKQVEATLLDLSLSAKDDEQNRGVLRALHHVRQMPNKLVEAANVELERHR